MPLAAAGEEEPPHMWHLQQLQRTAPQLEVAQPRHAGPSGLLGFAPA